MGRTAFTGGESQGYSGDIAKEQESGKKKGKRTETGKTDKERKAMAEN
jgi:hypothetical protein